MAKFLGAHLASPFLLCSCAKFCCDDHLCRVIFPSNRIAKLGKHDWLINSIRELFLKCFLHCKAAKKQRSKTLQYIREFGNWHIKKMSKSYVFNLAKLWVINGNMSFCIILLYEYGHVPMFSSGHFALIAGKTFVIMKIRIISLVTEVIGMVINVPLMLLGVSLFACSWKVKAHIPIFPSKFILPLSSYLG